MRMKDADSKWTRWIDYLNSHREHQRGGQLVMNAYKHATGIQPASLPDVWEIEDDRHPDVQEWYRHFHMFHIDND